MSIETLVNLNNIILLATIILNLGLAAYIFFKNRSNPINFSFGAMLFSVVIWALCFLLFQMNRSPEWALFLRRLTPIGASLIGGYFLYFSIVFPGGEESLSWQKKSIILLPGYIFALLSVFSSLMIKEIAIPNLAYPFLVEVTFGLIYRLFALYFMIYFGLGLYNLSKKYFASQGKEKLQIFYVLFGIAISGLIGIAASLLLPIMGITHLFSLGPPFTLVMAGFVTYAIVVHKLLNIEDFMTRGVYFLTAVAALVGTVFCFFTNNLRYLLFYYITLGHVALGIIVYSYNRRNKINIAYAWLVFFTGSMVFNSAIFFKASELSVILLAAKLIYISTFSLMIPLFYFASFFPFEKPKLSLLQKLTVPLPGFILSFITLFSDLLIKSVAFKPWGREVVFGPLFPFFAIYCALFVGYSFLVLINKHRISTGIQKTQIGYIFVSFLIIGVPAFSANILFPAIFNYYGFIEPALYFALPEAAIVAYAVLKHRLMSVEIMIQRGFVYTSVTALIVAFYAVAVMISEAFFRQVMGYSSMIVTGVAALLIAIVYQPLVKGFQSVADRLFFRGRYNYQKILKEISHRIASVIRLDELTKLIVSSVVTTMRVSEISFLLLEKEKDRFCSISVSLPRYKKIEIDLESPIIAWLSSTKDILVRDEVEDEITKHERMGLIEVRDEMERLGIPIWVPIVSKDKLIGIIALGQKLSGEMFTTEDIRLLSTLANQTAVALDNARLYDQVVNMKEYREKILESMLDGMLTVDIKGRIRTYNLMAEKITGRKIAEVLGKTCEEIWGKRGMITNVVENTLTKSRYYVNFEARIASPEKGLVPVSFSSTVLFDHHGKKMGALLTIQDLTEVKELEGKVRRADKLSALATMAAGMAHEIKNPLSSMKVLAQLLPRKIEDHEYRMKLQEIMPREINRIDRIVESLLGFARATTLKFEKVDIKDILEDNLKYFEDQAHSSEVKILKEYAQLPQIEIDKAQLSQVFSNLILNAIQAMPESGELKIVTLPGKRTENILRTVKIKISDTGHGISEDMQKKLFDPFYTTKHGGTGLGLTISHSVVDGHKGYIDLESTVGQGTTFTVTLPVSQGLV